MKTYEILQLKSKIEALENEFNEETGEFIDNSEKVKELLKTLEVEKEEKLKAIQHIISQKKALIEINKEEIKSIQSFNAQEEKNIIALNDMMGILLDGEKLQSNIGSFYYGKESVYIADEGTFKQNNPEYVKERQSINRYIDKTAVIKDIDKLKGARLRKGVIFRAKKAKKD